jgi:hypothetical protein
MKTTGAVLLSTIACFMHIDHNNDPAGETQTLDPRPRPAIWVVAVNVNPFGTRVRSFEFLGSVRKTLNRK